MDFGPGSRVGPYTLTSVIGEGGMGRVWRARHGALGREDALKILPEAFAADPDRLARFRREAQVLAALNHDNIARVYGLEPAGDAGALVMELVEGATLAERIAGGPIPLDEALPMLRQIAAALEAAHDRGIVHRDLKPANIKVRPDGLIKVLDFGLAKALSPVELSPDASRAGTITSPAMTRAGVILGTAAYMAPEQARGRAVDERADIWAFGCVAYEMLTGRRAFGGDDVADVLGALMHKEPDWAAVPATVPPVLALFLRRCLEKDRAQRVRHAGDLRLALSGAFEPAILPIAPRPSWPAKWQPAAAAVVAALIAGAGGWLLKPASERSAFRFTHVLPSEQAFTQTPRPLIAIAPDGSSFVYVAENRLYRRVMTEFEAVSIRGTEGNPTTPFFSPDGAFIGYWDAAAEELRAIPVGGGTPISIVRSTNVYGASWEADDTILFGREDGVWRVPAGGGAAQHLVRIQPGERVHGPRLLPDGRTLLFTQASVASMVGQSTAWDRGEIVAHSLETGDRTTLVTGSDARYIPSGHLVWARDTTLFAAAFDLAALEMRGRAVPIVENVQRAVRAGGSSGSANYDFSRRGTLVYVRDTAPLASVPRRLLLVDRNGAATPILDDERDYWRPRLSPDGRRVAVEVGAANEGTDIWIVDVETRSAVPLATDGENSFPAWTPDSRSVVYRSNRGGAIQLYLQPADGSRTAEILTTSAAETAATGISRDGIVAFSEGGQTAERKIRMLRLADKSVSDFLDTPALEHMADFSPDGRWVAYASNQSGQFEVYVRPYPGAGGVGRLVSLGGGSGPVWAPDGRTLYYRGASGRLMAVPVTLTPSFTAGRPQPLFEFAGIFRISGNAAAFDVRADGRFIMVSEPANRNPPPPRIHVVEDWFEQLRRATP